MKRGLRFSDGHCRILNEDEYPAKPIGFAPPRAYTPSGPSPGMRYETKDSGERVEFDSGMRRDTNEGKPRYDLIPVMPHRRLAELYARGSEKYGDRNWELANSSEEVARFRASAERHFMAWKAGEDDEDHAIAAVWNIFAALVIEEKLNS